MLALLKKMVNTPKFGVTLMPGLYEVSRLDIPDARVALVHKKNPVVSVAVRTRDVTLLQEIKFEDAPIKYRDVKDLVKWRNGSMFKDDPIKPNSTGTFWYQHCDAIFMVHNGRGLVYHLSPTDAVAFKNNDMSVIPPGCCNAAGGVAREFRADMDEVTLSASAFITMVIRALDKKEGK